MRPRRHLESEKSSPSSSLSMKSNSGSSSPNFRKFKFDTSNVLNPIPQVRQARPKKGPQSPNEPLSAEEFITAIQDASLKSRDHLGYQQNSEFIDTLDSEEFVIFSDEVWRFGSQSKRELRDLIITNEAFYLLASRGGRGIPLDNEGRIDLMEIVRIIASKTGDLFCIQLENKAVVCIASARRAFILKLMLDQRQIQLPVNVGDSLKLELGTVEDLLHINNIFSEAVESSGKSLGLSRHIKKIVSKKKIRYEDEFFDLDLTYITDKIIAMGFPSQHWEGLYRNRYIDVFRFLEIHHPKQYKVYNLCSEAKYDTKSNFNGNCAYYGFDDHHPAELKTIYEFCLDCEKFYEMAEDNVVAIHCKAGKGRTGLMISCLLLHLRIFTKTEDVLEFFAVRRTKDGKGVTNPSQLRYVCYYEEFLKGYLFSKPKRSFQFDGRPLILTKVSMDIGSTTIKEQFSFFVTVTKLSGIHLFDYREYAEHKSLKLESFTKERSMIQLSCTALVKGDFKVTLMSDLKNIGELGFVVLHTSMILNTKVILKKQDIDGLSKDKKNKKFAKDFTLIIEFSEETKI